MSGIFVGFWLSWLGYRNTLDKVASRLAVCYVVLGILEGLKRILLLRFTRIWLKQHAFGL